MPLRSELGPFGEVGLYYAFARQAGVSCAFRYARATYEAGGISVDASNAGWLLALHYNF